MREEQKIKLIFILVTTFFQLVLFASIVVLLLFTFVLYQQTESELVLNVGLTLCYLLFCLSIYLNILPTKNKKEDTRIIELDKILIGKFELKAEYLEHRIEQLEKQLNKPKRKSK